MLIIKFVVDEHAVSNECRASKSGSERKHDTSFKFEIDEMRRLGDKKKKK